MISRALSDLSESLHVSDLRGGETFDAGDGLTSADDLGDDGIDLRWDDFWVHRRDCFLGLDECTVSVVRVSESTKKQKRNRFRC